MLIQFTVGNFRSILDEQQFTFSASSDRTLAATHCMRTGLKSVPRLSKSAVVFGPNGSGKSNLVNAISVMRDLVLHSTALSAAEFAERHTPFLLGRSQGKPTEFGIDVLLAGTRYQYAFAYDERCIRAERLLVFPTGKSQRWFERSLADDGARQCWAPFSNNFTGPRAMWRDATRPQALFLSTAAQLNSRQLEPLFEWFQHGLALVFASDKADLTHIAEFVQHAGHKQCMLRFLRSAGMHVNDVRMADAPPVAPLDLYVGRRGLTGMPGRPMRAANEQTGIEFSHLHADGSDVWMRSGDESTGALRLVGLCAPLLKAMRRGQLLLVDEFDLSLHPLVARYIIQLINDPAISDRGAQLLLTSHNANLMDMGILRRDEIWLMELDDRNASTLRRVWHAAIPPRKNELIGKRYLYGRYGAVPDIRLPGEGLPVAPDYPAPRGACAPTAYK